MTLFPDSAIFLTIGNLSITWYALLMIVGLVTAYFFLRKEMSAHGYKVATCDDLFILCLFGGMIFGRIGWVMENWRSYHLYIWSVFGLADGGFDSIAILLGCGLVILPYVKKHKMSYFRTADVIAPMVLLVSIIAKAGKCFAMPKTWIVELINVVFFFLLTLFHNHWQPGHKRGDLTAMTLMMLGASRLIAMVYKLDAMAVNCLGFCILAEILGLALYVRNRRFRTAAPIILFDLDGTLMDSRGMVLTCFKWMYRKYGNIEDFNEDRQREIFGPPLREELARLFPDEDPDKLVHDYHAFQSTLPGRGVVDLMPQAEKVLDTLKQEGYVMGIVSSRLSASVETWIRDLKIDGYFSVVLGRDQFAHAKPAPDGILKACEKLDLGHDSCIYIGDGVSDVMAGRNAGVYTIAVADDSAKMERIRKASPNYIVTGLGEILPLLKEDHAWTYEKI